MLVDGVAAGACELGVVVLQVELSVPGPHPAVGVDCVGCELGVLVLQVELSLRGPHPAVGVDCVGCELGAVVLVDGVRKHSLGKIILHFQNISLGLIL